MNLKNIKNYLKTKSGSKVVIFYYGSRNKREVYKGIIDKVYKNIFTVKLLNNEIKSFSYVDVLTKTVQIYI